MPLCLRRYTRQVQTYIWALCVALAFYASVEAQYCSFDGEQLPSSVVGLCAENVTCVRNDTRVDNTSTILENPGTFTHLNNEAAFARSLVMDYRGEKLCSPISDITDTGFNDQPKGVYCFMVDRGGGEPRLFQTLNSTDYAGSSTNEFGFQIALAKLTSDVLVANDPVNDMAYVFYFDPINEEFYLYQTIDLSRVSADGARVQISDDGERIVFSDSGENGSGVSIYTRVLGVYTLLKSELPTSSVREEFTCNDKCSELVLTNDRNTYYYYDLLQSSDDVEFVLSPNSGLCDETISAAEANPYMMNNDTMVLFCPDTGNSQTKVVDINRTTTPPTASVILSLVNDDFAPSGPCDASRLGESRSINQFGANVFIPQHTSDYFYVGDYNSEMCRNVGGFSYDSGVGALYKFVYNTTLGNYDRDLSQSNFPFEICSPDRSDCPQMFYGEWPVQSENDGVFAIGAELYPGDSVNGAVFLTQNVSQFDLEYSISPNDTVCHEPQGPCEKTVKCTGDDAQCPIREFYGEETQCRAATGCFKAAYCNGRGAECPPSSVNASCCSVDCEYAGQTGVDSDDVCAENVTCAFEDVYNATLTQKMTRRNVDLDGEYGSGAQMDNCGNVVVTTRSRVVISNNRNSNAIFIYFRNDRGLLDDVQVLYASEECCTSSTYGNVISLSRIHGDILATVDKNNEGGLYVYKRNETQNHFYLYQYVTNFQTNFSMSPLAVDVSNDASTIVVGGANDIILLYTHNGTAYEYQKTIPNPSESTTFFGYYLSLNDDGTQLVASDPFNGNMFFYYNVSLSNDYTFESYSSTQCSSNNFNDYPADIGENAILIGCPGGNVVRYYTKDENDPSVLTLTQTFNAGDYEQVSSCPSGLGDGVRLYDVLGFGRAVFLGETSPTFLYASSSSADFCVESGGSSTVARFGAVLLFVHNGTSFQFQPDDEMLYTIDDSCISNPSSCESDGQSYGFYLTSTHDMRYAFVAAMRYNNDGSPESNVGLQGAVFSFERNSSLVKEVDYASNDTVCHVPQGPCEIEVTCTGDDTTCPARQFYNSTTQCAAETDCLEPSFCSGNAAECPAQETKNTSYCTTDCEYAGQEIATDGFGPCLDNITCTFGEMENATLTHDIRIGDSAFVDRFGYNSYTTNDGLVFIASRCPQFMYSQIGQDNYVYVFERASRSEEFVNTQNISSSEFCTGSCTFGQSTHIARDARELFVVANNEDGGAVYVFEKNESAGNYSVVQTINNMATVYGITPVSVTLSDTGSVLLVGGDNSDIIVFERQTNTYVNISRLSNPATATTLYGYYIACDSSCSTVAVNDRPNANVFLYFNPMNNDSHTEFSYTCSSPLSGDFIVDAVDLNDEHLVVSCASDSNTFVYEMDHDTNGVNLQQTIDGDSYEQVSSCPSGGTGVTLRDVRRFGISVFLSGRTSTFLYIGDDLANWCAESAGILGNFGALFTFVYDAGTWVFQEDPSWTIFSSACEADPDSASCNDERSRYGRQFSGTYDASLLLAPAPWYGDQGEYSADEGLQGIEYIYERNSSLSKELFYFSEGYACGNESACQAAPTCNGTSDICFEGEFYNSSQLCRNATSCSAAAYCTFGNETCPPNELFNSSVVCRPSQGICENDTHCTGDNVTCPVRNFLNSTVQCHEGTLCSDPAFCTGDNATCFIEAYNSSVVCRDSQGACEEDVFCPGGANYTCPARSYFNSSVQCHNGSLCSDPAFCSGDNATCFIDAYNSSVICRESEGPCQDDTFCPGGTNYTCPAPTYFNSTVLCANGTDCSEPSYCTFGNSSCPANEPFNDTVVCHVPQGPCEIEVTCTGDNTTCPERQFYNSSQLCRNATSCSAAAYCTLGNETCPPNELYNSSVACHDPQGPCEDTVYCTGDNTTCPARSFFNGTTLCSNGTSCSDPSFCTFGNSSCPANEIYNDTVVCLQSDGPCVGDTLCDGINSTCPDPDYFNSTVLCANGTDCSEPAYCTLGNSSCPANEPFNDTVVCHVPQGPCEIEVTCTGDNVTCPDRQFRNATYMCRAGTSCSAAAYCTFGNETCPPNELYNSSVICRTSQGPCENDTRCTGTNDTCPARNFLNSTVQCHAGSLCSDPAFCSGDNATCFIEAYNSSVVCRESQGDCEKDAFCPGGTNYTCPARDFLNSTVQCHAGSLCSDPAFCSGDNATCFIDVYNSSVVCRESQGVCEEDAFCPGGTNYTCPARSYFNSSVQCHAGSLCSDPAFCSGDNATCFIDAYNSSVVCRESQGDCEKDAFCPGGTNYTCPARDFLNSTVQCHNGSLCSDPAFCSGDNATCFIDVYNSSVVCRESQGPCENDAFCPGGTNYTCPAHDYLNSTVQCHNGTSCSDPAFCPGGNASCPIVAYNSTVVCHVPQDVCEEEVTCPGGNNITCPSRAFFNSSVLCDNGTLCSDPAYCTFGNETCPQKEIYNSSVSCRTPQGSCEKEVFCPGGLDDTCPPRQFFNASHQCRNSSSCGGDAFCTYGNETCPSTMVFNSTVRCRTAQGPCELDVFCPGGDDDVCPPRAFRNASYVCANGTSCSADSRCTYGNETCPARELYNSSVVCRISGGACEANVTCTGTNATCPAPVFFNSSVVCAPATLCADAVFCTFGNASCPQQIGYSSSVVCHLSQGPCENNVTCPGNGSVICPPRDFLPAGTTCDTNATSTNQCRSGGACNGTFAGCPPDAPAPDGTPCQRDTPFFYRFPHRECWEEGACQSGECVGGGQKSIGARCFVGSYRCAPGTCNRHGVCTDADTSRCQSLFARERRLH